MKRLFSVEQQAEADVFAGNVLPWRPALAELLGATLVVIRDGQSLIDSAQLRDPDELRQLFAQIDRAGYPCFHQVGRPEKCGRRTQKSGAADAAITPLKELSDSLLLRKPNRGRGKRNQRQS